MKAPHDWIVPDWPAPSRVKCIVTTRNGGVSTGPQASFNLGLKADDDPAHVHANRAQLRRWLPADPAWLAQVHGNRVVTADQVQPPVEADASTTRRADVVCAVMVADCMPVLFCDDSATVIAVAHAGWRGLSSGVLENTLAAMDVPPRSVMAYLGPAIGPAAFEVGADVRDAFLAADAGAAAAFKPLREGKWLADLFMLAHRRLHASGVARVYGGGLCTYNDPARFYSYRRDRVTGRMAALIWLADTQ